MSETPNMNPTPPGQSSSSPSGTETADLLQQIHAGAGDEAKSYLERVAFKDVNGLLSHAISLEKMIGADKSTVLSIPKEGRAENPAAWRDIDTALGVPADGKYGEFKPSAGELQATETQLNVFDAAMAKAGATKAVRNAALDAFHQINDTVRSEFEAGQKEELASAAQALQRAWGVAYPEKERAAGAALSGLDGEKEFVELMTNAGLGSHPLFTRVKAAIAELRAEAGAPPTGDGSGAAPGKLTPEQAKAKIEALEADEAFMGRYMKGDDSAIKEMLRLNEAAAAAS